MAGIRVTLVTGRTIYQGVGKELGKFTDEYLRSVAVCEMDPTDMDSLGVSEGDAVKVTTDFGSVIVTATESARGIHRGVIFLPYGPWANMLTNPETDGVGMPSFKGIPAYVEASPSQRVLSLFELLEEHYGKESV